MITPRLCLPPLLVAIACGIPVIAQPEVKPPGVLEIFKQVREEFLVSARSGDEQACARLLEGYQRAEAAPDATSEQIHDMLKYRLESMMLRGRALRDAGRLEDALEALTPGWKESQEHFENGRHFHTVIEAQGLYRELAMTLLEFGRMDDADGVIRFARKTLDVYWEAREKLKSEGEKGLLGAGLDDGERLEAEIRKFYGVRYFGRRGHSTITMTKAELRPRVIECCRRAANWVLCKDRFGVKNLMDVNPNIRFAEYKIDLGSALYDDGKNDEAAEEFLRAHSAVHDLADRPADPDSGWAVSAEEVKELTARAAEGWAQASGKFDEAFDAAFERWYKEEIKALDSSGAFPPIP